MERRHSIGLKDVFAKLGAAHISGDWEGDIDYAKEECKGEMHRSAAKVLARDRQDAFTFTNEQGHEITFHFDTMEEVQPKQPPCNLRPKHIRTYGPVTIVQWCDGTETRVRCSKDDTFDLYAAVGVAMLKKAYGSTRSAKRAVHDADEETIQALAAERKAEQEAERTRVRMIRRARKAVKRTSETSMRYAEKNGIGDEGPGAGGEDSGGQRMSTKLSDIINPDVFKGYVICDSTKKLTNRFFGAIENGEAWDALAQGLETLIVMPDGGGVARKSARTMAWSEDVLKRISPEEGPFAGTAICVTDFWADDLQQTVMRILQGVFKLPEMARQIVSEPTRGFRLESFRYGSLLYAQERMGGGQGLACTVMHPCALASLSLREYIRWAHNGDPSRSYPFLLDCPVITDTSAPFDPKAGSVAVYLLGKGAFMLANGSDPRILPVEIIAEARSPRGEEYLVSRRVYALHPTKMRWTEHTVDGMFPSNEELAMPENWTLAEKWAGPKLAMYEFRVS